MIPRKESFWFEGLKFAEDEIKFGTDLGVTDVLYYNDPPEYGLVPDEFNLEFKNGYLDCVEHYKSLGILK